MDLTEDNQLPNLVRIRTNSSTTKAENTKELSESYTSSWTSTRDLSAGNSMTKLLDTSVTIPRTKFYLWIGLTAFLLITTISLAVSLPLLLGQKESFTNNRTSQTDQLSQLRRYTRVCSVIEKKMSRTCECRGDNCKNTSTDLRDVDHVCKQEYLKMEDGSQHPSGCVLHVK